MFSRVQPSLLTPRLDADFYKIEFIENEAHLKEFGVKRLAKLIDIKASGYGVLPSSNEYCDDGVPLIRGGDLSYGEVVSPSVFAPLSYKDGKGTAIAGDVLILIKGACIDGPEGVARVKQDNHGHLFNGSCFRLAFTDREVDGPFFIAYSQSKFFLRQKKRQVANTGISYNDEDSIHGYLIPDLENGVKKYIGDKVRQAEQLRAWARRLECSIDCLLTTNNDYLSACRTPETKSSRPQLNDLSNRLDPKYYGNKAIAVQRFARKKGVILGDLIKSVANGFEERSFLKSGLAYITVSEVSSGRLNAQAAPKISKSVDVPSKAIIHESCVLVVRTGSIGTAVKVHELDKGCAISSHLIRLEFNDEETAAAVAVFLNSAAGKVLLHKISYGAVQPQIGQEELLALSIPEYVLNDKAKCLSLLNSYELAVRASANLTTAAKTLVEALIEGLLTEQQLIQAHQALEDGDNGLDRAILSKLSNAGYAIDGATPLFSDIDELYRLLESATQAEAEE